MGEEFEPFATVSEGPPVQAPWATPELHAAAWNDEARRAIRQVYANLAATLLTERPVGTVNPVEIMKQEMDKWHPAAMNALANARPKGGHPFRRALGWPRVTLCDICGEGRGAEIHEPVLDGGRE